MYRKDLTALAEIEKAITLLRMHDWSSTSLGAANTWPQSLKTTINIVIGSPFAMIALWGPELIQIYNDEYAVICGPRHPQAFGQPTRTCWPEVWEFNAPIYEAVLGGEARAFADVELSLHRNNVIEPAWFNLAYSPLRNEVDEIAGILVTVVETTPRILAERRLERQVAERTRELDRTWEVSPDLLGILNTDGFFESSNPAWQVTLGWSKAEIAATEFLEFVHLDDLDRTKSAYVAIQRNLPALRFENRYRRKDGTYRWLSWVAVLESGKIYCSARDVTAEKAQTEELALRTQERNLLEMLIEVTDVMIMAVGIDYRVLALNQATINEFERIYGVRLKVGADMLALLADLPEHQAQIRDVWETALAGREYSLIESFGDPARVRPSYEIKFKSLWNSLGERIGAYQFVIDVTERLREQAKLATAQDALRQSQKMEAVGQLTGGIAHDFNNMLQGISGALEMLQIRIDQGRLGEARHYMASARSGITSAAALTHRLLAFSRKQPLDPKKVDANQLIAGMIELVRRTVGPAIIVAALPADAVWMTLCDRNQLENALLNLAINARDAMPDGGSLTIETANVHLDDDEAQTQGDRVEAGEYVSVSVIDTGSGMTADVIKRAFEPFFTTKPLGEGTGMGLSMLYGFAKQSKGHAKIFSQPGHGTTVRLYLPRDQTTEVSPDLEATPRKKIMRSGLGEVILLVEDEKAVRVSVTAMLLDQGYHVLEAHDGPSALHMLQAVSYVDLLVTDVGLPGINGRELAMAAHKTQPNLKVLFITGYTHNAEIGQGEALETGMSIMRKPFELKMLAAKIRDMIDA